MSKSHKVATGETLGSISIKYYGVSAKWNKIVYSNPQLSTRKKASDGSPFIYAGDMLIIPAEDELPPSQTNKSPVNLSDNGDTDFSLYVDGKLFSGFSGFNLVFLSDAFDSFSFSAPFDSSVYEIKKAFKPFTYISCAVYYKKKISFNGILLTPDPDVQPESRTITLQGYPQCGVLNDVNLPVTKYPPVYDGMTLKQIARDAAEPFGISVVVEDDDGNAYEEVSCEPEEKILSFLNKLAEQHGLIYTNRSDGSLFFYKTGLPRLVALYIEGEYPFISCVPEFDPQNFYSHVTGFSKTENEDDSVSYTYENPYLIKLGVLRPFSFVVEDTDSENLEAAVKAKAGRMFGSAVKYKLTVEGVEDKNGELYAKNMFVAVTSPGAMIYRETKLLVKEANITRDDENGRRTVFLLVLPGSQSGELPEVFPWEE